jgi:hypothetical protein
MLKTATWVRLLYGVVAVTSLQACASPRADLTEEKFTAKCATANVDLRLLRSEKDVSKLATGGGAASSGGTDTGALVSVQNNPHTQSSAEYQAALDKRIASIKRDCQPLLLGSVR